MDPDHAIVLQIDSDMNINESNMTPEYAYKTTYTFLTETLGWKEGLEDTEPISINTNSQTCAISLAQFMFITKQMGWRKGLKLFGQKREIAITDELQQIMIWRASNQNNGMN